ncbi:MULTISPECIES: dihydrofolate reductase family protein [unclassified Janibacter]|uniref:dihydrofolate reductase family protein n=1 Tax=unclassified Janibacter TaxID=2649294 RepID=UPI003D047F8C
MTQLTYYTATTLDGFIADPDDSLDWLMRQDQDEQGPLNYEEFIAGIGALVMGSTTYEWLLRHHPHEWFYSVPVWVLTSRGELARPSVEADVRFAAGDVRSVYDAMVVAAGDKDLWVVGGGELAGSFADLGLLDEVITYIAPVTLGAGRAVLPRRLDLKLIESTPNKAFITARFEVVGPLTEDRKG